MSSKTSSSTSSSVKLSTGILEFEETFTHTQKHTRKKKNTHTQEKKNISIYTSVYIYTLNRIFRERSFFLHHTHKEEMSSKTSSSVKLSNSTGILEFELLGAKKTKFPHVDQPKELTTSCEGPGTFL